nr:MAG TPA: hypothetical protein [Caudoviricetes sp.]
MLLLVSIKLSNAQAQRSKIDFEDCLVRDAGNLIKQDFMVLWIPPFREWAD